MAKFSFLDRNAAFTLLQLTEEYWSGDRELPPEIVAKRKQIEALTRNAELFMARLRVVDLGMIDEIVEAKLELDTLLGRWAQSETPRTTL